MPWKNEWVPPEVFLKHREIKVYHVYADDDWDQGPRTYHFTLSEECGETVCDCPKDDCVNVFDVRELPTWEEPAHPPYLIEENDTAKNRRAWKQYQESGIEEKHIKEAIIKAIDQNILGQPRGKKEWRPLN